MVIAFGAAGLLLSAAAHSAFAGRWKAAVTPATNARAGRSAFDLGKAFGDLLSGKEEYETKVPEDVAALVAGLKSSTENTLNLGIGRLDIEIPPAYKLGVERNTKKGRLLENTIQSEDPTEVLRGDRELARIFVEMLQPVAEGLVVAFRSKQLAADAVKIWELKPGEATVISLPEKQRSAFAAEVGMPAQFLKKVRQDLRCQCLLVVSPTADQLQVVNELSTTVQDQMGIILLNARIHGKNRTKVKIPTRLRESLKATFPPSYHVRFLPSRKNSILFGSMGPEGQAPWVLAQQRELIGGRPVTEEVARFKEDPSNSEVEEAFARFDALPRGVSDKLLDLLDKENIGSR